MKIKLVYTPNSKKLTLKSIEMPQVPRAGETICIYWDEQCIEFNILKVHYTVTDYEPVRAALLLESIDINWNENWEDES
jgi:hypothetical protein